MSVVVKFPLVSKEPFRLDGQADQLAGARTRRLLTTQEALDAVVDLRLWEDSRELKRHERFLRTQLARERAFVETLEEAFRAAEWLAPTILREHPDGTCGTLLVFRQNTKSRSVESAAAFNCTSKGVVLVAHQMLIIPKRASTS